MLVIEKNAEIGGNTLVSGGNALTEILVSGRIAATSVTLERPQGAPSVNSLDGLPDGIYIVNGKKMLKK